MPLQEIDDQLLAPPPQDETIDVLPQAPVTSAYGGGSITDNPDGSSVVDFNPQSAFERKGEATQFDDNLVDLMSASERHSLAQRLSEWHQVDLESRKDWDELRKESLTLLGVKRVDNTRLPFKGAASVYHPVIAEAVVQFQANAIEEFYPAGGPVKGSLAGDATDESEAQVERAENFMNFYLTVEDPGYYPDTDQLLFILPIDGSIFRKAYKDPRDGLPKARFVTSDYFIAPYFAKDLQNCPRYAHDYELTGQDIKRAIAMGEFADVNLAHPGTDAPDSTHINVEDESDRRERVLHQDDRLYKISEYHCDLNLAEGIDELDVDGAIELPYIVVIDRDNNEVLSLKRNWKEGDPQFKKRVWFTHYKFLPGLGFYGWGFPHVIGALGEAAGGAVRALLDAALFATVQGGFRAKDGLKKGEANTIEPGKWKDIDATSEELVKTFFTPPFKEPSPALFQLLGLLIGDARRFASITEVLVGTANNKAPVGTTLALIEQSMKLFTAIHKRIFDAAKEEFRMMAELFYDYAPYESYPYFLKGEAQTAFREDFDDRVDFIPVADPNIVSSVQRVAIAQAILELIAQNPELYTTEKKVAAHKRFLKALKVQNAEDIEPEVPTPNYLDPIGENAKAFIGQPLRAFPGQRHDLHILAHQNAVQTAMNTLPPDQADPVYQALMSHIREHQALQMIEQVSASMQQTIGVPMPPVDIYENNEDLPPDLEMAITIATSRFLPPVPPPMDQGQAPPEADPTAALEAETQAGIERDTVAFAAEEKRKQAEHDAELRRGEETHRQKMQNMDDATVADILRKNAAAIAQRRTSMAQSAIDMIHKRKKSALELNVASHKSQLTKESAAAQAKAKKAKSNGASHASGG